jgi:drug/metabolite transporter (DMT)-like permease
MSNGSGSNRAVAVASLAVLAVALGTIPLIVRAGVPSTHLVGMRVSLGAAVLVLFSAATARLVVPWRRWRRIVLLGVVLTAHWLLFFVALNLTTVAVALAIVYIGPVLTAVLAGPVLHEQVSKQAVAGLAMAVVGMLLVVRPGAGATVAGVAAAMASGVLFTAVMLIGKPLVNDVGGLAIATWELVVASIILAPFTIQAVRESSEFWPQFMILGALFTGLAGVVYWTAMSRLPVAVVSVILYLEPASAVVWAALFLGEQPGPLTWVGVVLVVVAGTVATRGMVDGEAVGVTEVL